MVTVDWTQDPQGRVVSLQCLGHAGFDEIDLVCAAVSALIGALGIGLTQVVEVAHRLEVGQGHFSLALEPEHVATPGAQVLLRTTVLALEELIENYPGFIARPSA